MTVVIPSKAKDSFKLAGTTPTTAGLDLLDDADAAAQRMTLGLGTIATQDSNSVSLTGGSITGITAVVIADGGTGASTATNASMNLGLPQCRKTGEVENRKTALKKPPFFPREFARQVIGPETTRQSSRPVGTRLRKFGPNLVLENKGFAFPRDL